MLLLLFKSVSQEELQREPAGGLAACRRPTMGMERELHNGDVASPWWEQGREHAYTRNWDLEREPAHEY